jgi:hypothetical protein
VRQCDGKARAALWSRKFEICSTRWMCCAMRFNENSLATTYPEQIFLVIAQTPDRPKGISC